MRTFGLGALIVILVTGCAAPVGSAGPAGPTGLLVSPSTAATPGSAPVSLESTAPPPSETTEPPPSATTSQRPTAPPDLARVAVKERDDIRVVIELQRNPLPAGEPSWVKVRVTNEGRTDVTWFHDGCAEPVSVHGVSEIAWTMGEEHQGQAWMFKAYALGGSITAAPDPHGVLSFVEQERLHTGPTGCADIGISETIKPGKSVRTIRWWSGFTDPQRALPAPGPATIRGFAGYYWRGKEPTDIIDHAIKLELDAWIISDEASDRLSPAQAVDAALSDPTFTAYLETQAIANGRAAIAWYDATHDLWEIGVMPWYETEPPRIHGVLVDATTGAVVGPLDRSWDKQVDPFP